jgi:hypothetical protein
MPADTQLPQKYKEYKDLDMTRESMAYLTRNILMAILLLAFFILLSRYAANTRADFEGVDFGGLRGWGILAIFIVAYAMMYAHAGITWLSLKLFSGVNPVYQVNGLTPRAVLKGVYLPKGPYLLAKSLPVLSLTALYLILAPVVPVSWLELSIYFFAGNIAYAVPDLIAIFETARAPKGTLVEDTSEHIFLYSDKELIKK